ncbi:MAG: GAF domain-containing protein [Balneolaceae bacterium]|nr:GAF domain-containing protein [Balneolaceae bacterium]MBO6545941.1 GAF domain-containing protein [Balneolaceae bacterium]MBO6647337.1 GAF domain-containing protein [Balneolaceae bacterium]
MAENYKHMQLLLHAIEGINRTMELKSLLLKCMNSACQVMEAEASSLMLIDEVTGELHVSIPTGPIKDKIKGMSIPRDKGVAGWVLKSKEPYFTNELKDSDIFWGELSSEFSSQSIMCVPLLNSKKEAIGVLQVLNKLNGKEFKKEEIPVFETLAGHVALSIEKVKEVDDLKKKIKEKESKLKEVHQGLKSNLAAINALIQLEVPTIDDELAQFVLKATGSRIEAISNAHHILYNQDEFEYLDLGLYLGRLTSIVSEIFEQEGKEISLLLDMDKIALKASVALTVGLIVNEVLVNMYKDAFVIESYGKITLAVKKDEQNCVAISISDDGGGLKSNLDGSEEDSLGSIIIKTLASKLDATLTQRTNDAGGTTFTILFYN